MAFLITHDLKPYITTRVMGYIGNSDTIQIFVSVEKSLKKRHLEGTHLAGPVQFYHKQRFLMDNSTPSERSPQRNIQSLPHNTPKPNPLPDFVQSFVLGLDRRGTVVLRAHDAQQRHSPVLKSDSSGSS